MYKFDMINFQRLFTLNDQNRLNNSLYENLSKEEKRILYNKAMNQKLTNLNSNILDYLIFTIVQILFLIAMILLMDFSSHYTAINFGFKPFIYILPAISLASTAIGIFFAVLLPLSLGEPITDDIEYKFMIISLFSSLFLTFLIYALISLILTIIYKIFFIIKRELSLNSSIVKDQANYYENKFINYFHQIYYDQNKTAYFKHDVIKNLHMSEDGQKIYFELVKGVNKYKFKDEDIVNHNNIQREMSFDEIIKKLELMIRIFMVDEAIKQNN